MPQNRVDASFIARFPTTGTGPRLAVKDLIDIAGTVTTAGSLAVADNAVTATVDARCLAGARAAGARIVGKTNLHELAYGASGINSSYGTPVNPLDRTRCPGGSSSGSAVAVANEDADVAYGSDTGGSVRLPAACCGIVGLKTTWGRVPTERVRPLAPSLDTIGPMATTVGGVVLGMQLLEPGFTPSSDVPRIVGRFRPVDAYPTNPVIDDAIDRALCDAELEVIDIALDGWHAARRATLAILWVEAWRQNSSLLGHEDRLTAGMGDMIRFGSRVTPDEEAEARAVKSQWLAELEAAFGRVQAIVLPTMSDLPPPLDNPTSVPLGNLTIPLNLSGSPALALPIPLANNPLMASMQMVGRLGAEESLVTLGAHVEAAIGARSFGPATTPPSTSPSEKPGPTRQPQP